MYVAPFVLFNELVVLILNPLDNKSNDENVDSANDWFGTSRFPVTLYMSLAESNVYQDSTPELHLTKIYRGLNPQYTNGPSADPLPV